MELNQYNGVPHLLTKVINNPKKAAEALQWAVAEMDRRYDLLSDAHVRDIIGYREKFDAGALDPNGFDRFPFIVVIVDELNDLMMVAGREVEEAIVRIAQMASHLLAGKHPAGVLGHRDRARLVVRYRVTVARAVRGKVVALDHAGVALADGGAGNVHFLPDREYVDADHAADLEVGGLLGCDAEFLQHRPRFDARFGEMTGGGLVDPARAALAVGDLDRTVAIGLGRFDLGHAIVRHIDYGHRDRIALVGENARHADLATDLS